jgi:hypothetical protein
MEPADVAVSIVHAVRQPGEARERTRDTAQGLGLVAAEHVADANKHGRCGNPGRPLDRAAALSNPPNQVAGPGHTSARTPDSPVISERRFGVPRGQRLFSLPSVFL